MSTESNENLGIGFQNLIFVYFDARLKYHQYFLDPIDASIRRIHLTLYELMTLPWIRVLRFRLNFNWFRSFSFTIRYFIMTSITTRRANDSIITYWNATICHTDIHRSRWTGTYLLTLLRNSIIKKIILTTSKIIRCTFPEWVILI